MAQRDITGRIIKEENPSAGRNLGLTRRLLPQEVEAAKLHQEREDDIALLRQLTRTNIAPGIAAGLVDQAAGEFRLGREGALGGLSQRGLIFSGGRDRAMSGLLKQFIQRVQGAQIQSETAERERVRNLGSLFGQQAGADLDVLDMWSRVLAQLRGEELESTSALSEKRRAQTMAAGKGIGLLAAAGAGAGGIGIAGATDGGAAGAVEGVRQYSGGVTPTSLTDQVSDPFIPTFRNPFAL